MCVCVCARCECIGWVWVHIYLSTSCFLFLPYFLFSSFTFCFPLLLPVATEKRHEWCRRGSPSCTAGGATCERTTPSPTVRAAWLVGSGVHQSVHVHMCVCVCVYVCVCRCGLGGMLGKYVSDSEISLVELCTTVDKCFKAGCFNPKVFVNCLQNDLLVCS